MPEANEFFYLDEAGNKQDAELHATIINPVDFPIDEKIMAPIRARHRAAHEAKQNAKARALRWPRIKARSLQLLDFDPSQPRDEHGRWTDGGGSDDGSVSGSPSPYAKDPTSASSLLRIEHDVTPASVSAKIPGADEQIADARAKLKASVPTDAPVEKGGHKLPDGSWTPERMAVHRAIRDQIMTPEAIAAAVPKQGAQPVLQILGGRGGSGKGWFTKPGGPVDTKTALYLNSDDVKEKLPEYGGWNAGLLHEESSYVGDAMEQAALGARLNVIIDATLKSGATTEKRINAYKAAGYRIEGYYMYASPVRAAEQATGRFVRGNAKNGKGRFVPPEYSMGSLTNEASFDRHRDDMDHWAVYDNMSGTVKLHSSKK